MDKAGFNCNLLDMIDAYTKNNGYDLVSGNPAVLDASRKSRPEVFRPRFTASLAFTRHITCRLSGIIIGSLSCEPIVKKFKINFCNLET